MIIIASIIARTIIIIIQRDVNFVIEGLPVPQNHMEHIGEMAAL